MPTYPLFLVDACVTMDYFLPYRERNAKATVLFKRMAELGLTVHVPAHSIFETYVTLIVENKRQRAKLSVVVADKLADLPGNMRFIDLAFKDAIAYAQVLKDGNLPDLKSADLIYFCMAKLGSMALITEDGPLHREATKYGIATYNIDSATAYLAPP